MEREIRIDVKRIQVIRNIDKDRLYIGFRLEDGSTMRIPVPDGTAFETASVLWDNGEAQYYYSREVEPPDQPPT